MDFNGYEIWVTEESLPTLEETWTRVDLGSSFTFRKSSNSSRTFSISGYIQKDDMETTRTEAEGLNESLASNPAGTYLNGFGTYYTVYVDSYEIQPIAGVNKYTFSMNLRILNENLATPA